MGQFSFLFDADSYRLRVDSWEWCHELFEEFKQKDKDDIRSIIIEHLQTVSLPTVRAQVGFGRTRAQSTKTYVDFSIEALNEAKKLITVHILRVGFI